MWLLEEHSTKRSKGIGKDFRLGLPILSRLKRQCGRTAFGQASRINSVHRQSIKDLAPNFRATAFDPRDHTIEAIEAVDGHRIMGLQWHPEYLVNEEKGI